MLVFEERGKPEYPEKNLSEQRREPTTNSTHRLRRVQESIPSHISGRRVLSPLRHPWSLQPVCLTICFAKGLLISWEELLRNKSMDLQKLLVEWPPTLAKKPLIVKCWLKVACKTVCWTLKKLHNPYLFGFNYKPVVLWCLLNTWGNSQFNSGRQLSKQHGCLLILGCIEDFIYTNNNY